MPLFGPRLDDPSAIGDEGRPRATSLTVASLVVFGLFLVGSHAVGVLRLALSVAGVTGLLTLGLALLNRDRFLQLFLGQLSFVLAGSGLVGLTGVLLFFAPSYGLLFGGFVLALVGVSATWADVADRDSATTALFQCVVSYVSMLTWFVVVVVVAVVVAAVFGYLAGGAGAVGPTASALVFLGALVATSVLTYFGVRWLPIRQLTARPRRPLVDARLAQLRWAIGVVGATATVLFAAVAVLSATGVLGAVYAAVPPTATLSTATSSPYLIGGLLGVGALVFLSAVAAYVLRRVTRPVDVRSNRLLAGVLAGFALAVLLLPFVFQMIPLPPLVALLLAFLLVFAGPVVLVVTGGALVVAVEVGVLPDRAGGAALAAAGLVAATVGAGLVGAPAPFVFACAAGALVVWDVSTFGLGVTAELGHLPETRRIELFHAVLGVGVAVVVVAGASAAYLLRESLLASPGNVGAVLLAVLGVLLLLIPIRG